VKFYEGKEGLKEMVDEFLSSGEKEAVEFFSLNDVNKIFTESEADKVGEKRRENQIKINSIFTDESADFKPDEKYRLIEDDLTTSIQLDEKEFPLQSDIIVFNDKVSIASLRGDVSGVIIKNKAIAQTIRSIFDLASNEALKFKDKKKSAS
jgi:hypothetical protein